MKKFVSLLLVVCCLTLSCFPALAATWSSDRVLDSLKRSMSDLFDDYRVTRWSTSEFRVEIVYDTLLTAKNCSPSHYYEIRNSFVEQFLHSAWVVWTSYSPTTKIVFRFVDSFDRVSTAYCTFVALGGGEFGFSDEDYPIGVGNSFVALGADPAILQMLIDTYGAFADDYIAMYTLQDGYLIVADSVYSSSFVGYLNAGNAEMLEYLRTIYKNVLWNIIQESEDCDPKNISVSVFFEDGDDYVYVMQYKNGDITDALMK